MALDIRFNTWRKKGKRGFVVVVSFTSFLSSRTILCILKHGQSGILQLLFNTHKLTTGPPKRKSRYRPGKTFESQKMNGTCYDITLKYRKRRDNCHLSSTKRILAYPGFQRNMGMKAEKKGRDGKGEKKKSLAMPIYYYDQVRLVSYNIRQSFLP